MKGRENTVSAIAESVYILLLLLVVTVLKGHWRLFALVSFSGYVY